MAQNQVKVEYSLDVAKALQDLTDLEAKFEAITKKPARIEYQIDFGITKRSSTATNALKQQFESINATGFTRVKQEAQFLKSIKAEIRLQKQRLSELNKGLNRVKGAGKENNTTAQRFAAEIKRGTRELKKLEALLGRANTSFKGAVTNARAISDALKSIKVPFSGLFKGLKGITPQLFIAGTLVEALKSALGGLSDVIQQGAAFEQLQLGLKAFTASSEEASFIYKRFKDIALKTPFGLQDVAEAGKIMLAFGVDTITTSKSLGLLSNAAAATGGDLNNLARNLGQIKAQNQAFKRDLDQFAIAGIGIYDALAQATGRTVNEVRQLTKDGKIGFNEVLDALELLAGPGTAYAEVAAAQLETLSGQWGNLKTQVFEFSGALVQAVNLTGFIKGVGGVLEFVKNNLDKLIGTATVFLSVGAAIKVLALPAYFNKLGLAIKGVALFSAVKNALQFSKTLAFIGPQLTKISAALLKMNLMLASGFTYWQSLGGALKLGGVALVTLTAKVLLVAGALALVGGVIARTIQQLDGASDQSRSLGAANDNLKQKIEETTAALQKQRLEREKEGKGAETSLDRLLAAQDRANQKFAEGRGPLNGLAKIFRAIGDDTIDTNAQFGYTINLVDILAGRVKQISEIKQFAETLNASLDPTSSLLQLTKDLLDASKGNSTELAKNLKTIKDNVKAAEGQLNLYRENYNKVLETVKALRKQKTTAEGLTADQQYQLVALEEALNILAQQVGEYEKLVALAQALSGETAKIAQADPIQQAKQNTDAREKQLDVTKAYWEVVKEGYEDEIKRIEELKDKNEEAQNEEIKALERTKKETKQSYNERIKAIEEQKKASIRAYDAEINKLKEKNQYEKQLTELEKDKLRRQIASGRLSGKALLEAKAKLQRIIDEEKITALNNEKKAKSLQLDKQKEKVQKESYEREKQTAEAIQQIKDALVDTNKGYDKRIDALKKNIENGDKAVKQQERFLEIDQKITEALEAGDQAIASQYANLRGIASAIDKAKPGSEAMALALTAGAKGTSDIFKILQENTNTFSNLNFENLGKLSDIAGNVTEGLEPTKNLRDALVESDTASGELSTNTSNIAGYITTSASQAIILRDALQAAASVSSQIKTRQTGGAVLAGDLVRANEVGQEAFLGASGFLSKISTDRNGYWRAPERGTVIPAHLTKELNIPDTGVQAAAPTNPNIGKAHSSYQESVGSAIGQISESQANQAVELGKLSEQIKRMTSKEWAVQVQIENDSSANLINKARHRN